MDRKKDFEQVKHTEWLFVRESYNGVQFNQGRGLAGQMVANWSVWWLRRRRTYEAPAYDVFVR